jgi:hypothetical protein
MKLFVRQVGNEAFPRYAIQCENLTWWTGQEWSPDSQQAMCYASLPVVKEDWNRLRERMDGGSDEVMELEGRFTVSVDRRLTPEQLTALAWYLSEASRFFLDYSHPRPEGLEGMCVSTQIQWRTLREKEEREQ